MLSCQIKIVPIFRELKIEDYDKGYLKLLTQLSQVGNISKEDFLNRYNLIKSNPFHKIYVIEYENKIISSGTLLIEPKFIHNKGNVAHIEDIVVHSEYRKLSLGKKIIKYLTDKAKNANCYKIILNCDYNVKTFYEKNNFIERGLEMGLYFEFISKI